MKKAETIIFFLFFIVTGRAQNVGIGETSPLVLLHVKDTISIPPGITPPKNLFLLGRNGQFLTKWDPSFGIGLGSYASGSIAQTRVDFLLGHGATDIPDTSVMTLLSNGSIGIGTTTPAASAQLEVSSTNKGVLLPRMTTVQKNAIINPEEGVEVYDLTLHQKSYYNGSAWVSLAPPSSTAVFLPTIVIGTQQWMSKNLDVAFYRNGDPIPQVTDPTAWTALTTGAWCYYNNDSTVGTNYGKLYNWYAVNDPRGLAPQGWHIPSDAEWTTLENTLGGSSVAGGKMKEAGTFNWTSPNTAGNNNSGWAGLPGGFRYNDGPFDGFSGGGLWWSGTEFNLPTALYRTLSYDGGGIGRSNNDKEAGFSVRCLRD